MCSLDPGFQGIVLSDLIVNSGKQGCYLSKMRDNPVNTDTIQPLPLYLANAFQRLCLPYSSQRTIRTVGGSEGATERKVAIRSLI